MNNNLKTYSDLLPCIPLQKFEFEVEQETNRVIILRPKYLSKWTTKYIMPLLKQKHFRVKLDELGSLVWKNCDGKNSVEDLIRILQKELGDSEEQIYERLAKYILHLQKEKFLELRCPSTNL